MNIKEMHNAFRTIGQKIGLQQVRGILPESIDVYLNDVIMEKTRQELVFSTAIDSKLYSNNQASTMSSINTFKNLFKKVSYSIDKKVTGNNKKLNYINDNIGLYIINIPIEKSNIEIDDNEIYINPLLYLGFSINYDNNKDINTKCRIIPIDVVEDVIRDYCNRPDKDNPIITMISSTGDSTQSVKLQIYTNTKSCVINNININYIKVPNVVKFDNELSKCVNCDLAEYTHYEIVEKAVQKFYTSINGFQTKQNNGNE